MSSADGTRVHNEVYSIRYSHRADALKRNQFYNVVDCGDELMPMDFYAWLLRTPTQDIVFDTGFTRETAEETGRTFLKSPVDSMIEMGVNVHAVQTVLLSHLHFDHTGHIHMFPNATFVVQAAEMAFWYGKYVSRGEYKSLCRPQDLSYLSTANRDGRVKVIEGDYQVAPGISLHHTPGHTPGSQVLRVETESGPLVLASDTVHYYANIEDDMPHRVVHTVPLVYDAYDRINQLAGSPDRVIAGHDPLVMKRFPALDTEHEGMVHRLG